MPASRPLVLSGLAAAWLAMAAPARAGPPLPLSGIGRVDLADAFCTGTLVAPALVLTAAHCLFDDDGRGRLPTRFVAGLDGARQAGEAKVAGTYVPPGYDYGRFTDTDEIDGLDWAVLFLDRDLSDSAAMVPIADLRAAPLRPSRHFVNVGYGADGGMRPTVRRDCRVLLVTAATWGHRCGSVEGDSGGPDLALVDGVWRIIGIESVDEDVGDAGSLAVAVSALAFRDAGKLAPR